MFAARNDLTGFAVASALIEIRVFFVVGVPPRAVSHLTIDLGRLPPSYVYGVRDGFKMIWVNAVCGVAFVIKL